MDRQQVEAKIREWRDEMDDADMYDNACEKEVEIANQIGIPGNAIREQVVIKLLTDEMLKEFAEKLFA